MADKTTVLPVAPLRDGPVFPNTDIPLVFGRTKSVAALKSAVDTNRLVFISWQQNGEETEGQNLHKVGTVCQIKHFFHSESETNVLVTGLVRAKIVRLQSLDDLLVAQVEEIPDLAFDPNEPEAAALVSHVTAAFQAAVRLGRGFDFFVLAKITAGLGAAELANLMGHVLDFSPAERQVLLEDPDVKSRLKKVAAQLAKEVNTLELERKIITTSQEKFEKSVRKGWLQERKKAIEKELGEGDDEENENKEMEERAKKAGMPEEVRKKTLKEIKRLTRMSSMNPEWGYIRAYVEWLLDLPWNISSPNNADITQAERILNEDHYGLEKVKERVVEYLAVLKMKHQAAAADAVPVSDAASPASTAVPATGQDSPPVAPGGGLPAEGEKRKPSTPTILCFVGPPGVGKTSIGKSIARALGRKFARISLGGIRDEAEIRGHRRTYVGALPGRIIQGMKQAGTKNPVFMLDELDKIGNDFRGDPSAALLEALDPEQNHAFADHYLDVPFDLSEVIFITTANVLETIPPALLDRLEIIHFPGYTSAEKLAIAKKYLLPKQIEANGLTSGQAEITEKALKVIISRYTKEAGVRNLEREMAAVLRKIAKKIAAGKANGKKTVVSPADLGRYLGPFKFTSTLAERRDEVGLSTGLFWTQAGGGILLIEVATMPGKGVLTLTGHLGDVMQESARAALSFVRSRWQNLGLSEKLFGKIDIHVHVPEGAIPKDGPSAGIAITTALASALTKTPVKKQVGLTGEVTLRGRVLEVGGIKEKVIGAHLAGVKTIVLPKDNEKDLEEIPKYILKDLEFRFVEGMDEVLEIAFARPWKTKEVEETGGHYAPQFLVAHDSSTAGVHHRLPN